MVLPLTLTNHSYTESECRVESPIEGLRAGITCVLCHLSFCKVQCLKPVKFVPCITFPSGNDGVPTGATLFYVSLTNGHSYPLALGLGLRLGSDLRLGLGLVFGLGLGGFEANVAFSEFEPIRLFCD